MCGVRRMDKIRNAEVLNRCKVESIARSVSTEMERAQLTYDVVSRRWFGNMERMPQDRVNKKVYQGEIPG